MKRDGHSWHCTKRLLLSLAVLYPATVFAADTALLGESISFVKVFFVILMASWGALASSLQRFSKGQFPAGKAGWVVASDFVNATLAGVIVYLACEAADVRPALQAIAVSLAGFGGSRFMTAIYLKFEGRAQAAIGGGSGDAPSQ